MRAPKISVLLSSYNHERYIRRTIESVLNQTYTDFELIIVDDCSTDHSKQVIESYTDPRIRAFFLNPNQGMGMAFNYSIKQATGEYLARIDSDDFWALDKLEKQLDYMEAHPETGACFSWAKVIDENENEVPSSICDRGSLFAARNRSQAEWLHQFYSKGCVLCHTSAFIRRSVLAEVGIYNYSLKQIQDLELWTRIAKRYPLHVICEPLVYYRWFVSSAPNVSAPSQEVMTRGAMEFFYLLYDFHNNLPDATFAEAFRQDFLCKNASSHEELLCERALLMLKQPYLGHSSKIIAILMLNRLLQEDKTRDILNNTYRFTIRDYNALCAEKMFYDTPVAQVTNEQGKVYGEISFKELVKKHLKNRPRLYSFARKIYVSTCKP